MPVGRRVGALALLALLFVTAGRCCEVRVARALLATALRAAGRRD